MTRKARITEVLNRVINDRAATEHEKAEARRALERIKDAKPEPKRARLSWDHGGWRTENSVIFGMVNSVLKRSGREIKFTSSPCTDKQFAYICKICDWNNWEAPTEKLSYDDAQAWLNYYAQKRGNY